MVVTRLSKNKAIGICPNRSKLGIVLMSRIDAENGGPCNWSIEAIERYELDTSSIDAAHRSMENIFSKNKTGNILVSENVALPIVIDKTSSIHIPATVFCIKAGFRVFLPKPAQATNPYEVENKVARNEDFWKVFGDEVCRPLVDQAYLAKARDFIPDPEDFHAVTRPRIFDDVRLASNAAMAYLTMIFDDVPPYEYRPVLFREMGE